MPFDGAQYIVDPRIAVLRLGRERIATLWGKGWHEDVPIRKWWWQFWRKKDWYCAATAVDGHEDSILVLLHALGMPWGDEWDLYDWNDAPERTQAEVLALYDQSIRSLCTRAS